MNAPATFTPLAAATREPADLAMQRLWLTGHVLPVGARLVVQHVFRSSEKNALEIIYSFPLPRDAALRSFRVTGEDFEALSELKPIEAAVRAYEKGLAEGSLVTLAQGYQDGLVNLTIGNIRPNETITVHLEILCGVESRDDGFRFRFPFTLAPCYHDLAKATWLENGALELELPTRDFGNVILPRLDADASALHQVGFDLTLASPLRVREIASPSHAVRVSWPTDGAARISLAAEKDVPNRDLVFDVGFHSAEPMVIGGHDSAGKGRFAAVIPSSLFGPSKDVPRRVVILLDCSGSMKGEPLSQARKAIAACLGLLTEQDSFCLVKFNDTALSFQPELVAGSRRWRDAANIFLMQAGAAGGTRLPLGIQSAANLLQGGAGDIFILTDGQVLGTEAILADVRTKGVRLHCLGIGSASQDRFLALLARETGGVSRFVTPQERVDLSGVDLFASIRSPLASGLAADDAIRPRPTATVFSGSPVVLFGEGEGPIELSWDGGRLTLPVKLADDDLAETIWLLQGSRRITDWESRYLANNESGPLEQRKENRLAARLLDLSREYGLASREMALVAVVARAGDRADELPDTRVEALGMVNPLASRIRFGAPVFDDSRMVLKSIFSAPAPKAAIRSAKAAQPRSVEDTLLQIGSLMESDGGMPGKSQESRAIASIVALLALVSHGHTLTQGAFRSHVARLIAFLESMTGLGSRQEIVTAALDVARRGTAPAGEWVKLADFAGDHWTEVENALAIEPKRKWFGSARHSPK